MSLGGGQTHALVMTMQGRRKMFLDGGGGGGGGGGGSSYCQLLHYHGNTLLSLETSHHFFGKGLAMRN